MATESHEKLRKAAKSSAAASRCFFLLFVAFCCLLAAPPPSFASSSNAGGAGATFLDIGQGSARAMAMGRAFVGMADGIDALAWNPAGIATVGQDEFAYSYLSYLNGLDTPLYMAYVHPAGLTVWGANVGYIHDMGFDVRDTNGVPLTNLNSVVWDGYGTLSVAHSFDYEKLLLGGSVRIVNQDLAGYTQDSVVGDAGFEYRPRDFLSVGASMQNFGAPVNVVGSIARMGFAVHPDDIVTLSFEADKPQADTWRAGLGAEISIPEAYLQWAQMAFRLGYYSADQYGQSFNHTVQVLRMDRTSGLSVGFGFFTSRAFGYGLSLDYAFVPFGALGVANQITVEVKY